MCSTLYYFFDKIFQIQLQHQGGLFCVSPITVILKCIKKATYATQLKCFSFLKVEEKFEEDSLHEPIRIYDGSSALSSQSINYYYSVLISYEAHS